MNWKSLLTWGFAATVILTGLTSVARGMGLTRMDLPFMLGTMVTPNRDRARLYGFLMHMMNGWIFASVYALFFESMRKATWWLGMGMGLATGSSCWSRQPHSAGSAPSHGLRARRARTDPPTGAARLHDAELRPAHAPRHDRGSPGLRHDPRRVLSAHHRILTKKDTKDCREFYLINLVS